MMAANNASSFNGHPRCYEGVCDTPLHIYHLFVGDSFMAVVAVDYSPTTVRAQGHTPSS